MSSSQEFIGSAMTMPTTEAVMPQHEDEGGTTTTTFQSTAMTGSTMMTMDCTNRTVGKRRRRRSRCPSFSSLSASSSALLPAAAGAAALLLATTTQTTTTTQTIVPTANAIPMSNSVSGGYLTHPPSRNYIAWASNALLPSASRPLETLPELEPTPHNLAVGPTCGEVDGAERDYDVPMSRVAGKILPLSVQAVYSYEQASGIVDSDGGGDDTDGTTSSKPGIEVKISLFGIDGGGHFEFHACPVTYPESPTEECFQKYPLTFLSDEYYGAVPDPNYPERAYVPYLGVFSSNGFSGGWEPIVDDHVGPGGGEMMEFKYRLKFPEDENLWTEEEDLLNEVRGGGAGAGGDDRMRGRRVLQQQQQQRQRQLQQSQQQEGGGGNGGSIIIQSQALDNKDESSQQGEDMVVQTVDWAAHGVSPPDVNWAFNGAAPAGTNWGDASLQSEQQGDSQEANQQQQQQQQDQTVAEETKQDSPPTVVNIQDVMNQHSEALTTEEQPPPPPQALDPDWAAKQEVPEGYPDIFWAEDLDTDWAIELQKEHDANPPNTGIAPEGYVDPAGANTNDDNGENIVAISAPIDLGSPQELVEGGEEQVGQLGVTPTTANSPEEQQQQEKQPFSSSTIKIPSSSNKYVLLRWHYVTARDCHQPGYESYQWPPSWGPWQRPWGGLCQGDEGQVEYFNCAEVMILGPDADISPPTMTPTDAPTSKPEPITILSTGVSPKAVSDLVFVGVSEVAYLNVLQNDADPEGEDLVIGMVTQPEHGVVTIEDEGVVLKYEPVADYTGTDFFEYSACDPTNLCDNATVEVLVGPVIDLLFAKDDRAKVPNNEITKLDVTANDVVRDDYPIIITQVRGGRYGNCSITEDNQVEYTPKEGFTGRDRCEYTVCITETACDDARLEIQVMAPAIETMTNADPVAKNDAATIDQNELAHIDPLRNDEDADGDMLVIKEVTAPSNGDAVIVNGGLSVEYMPDEDFNGVDVFTYTVCDTSDRCDSADISVIVKPSLKAINAVDDGVLTGYEEPIKIDVIANDEVIGDEEPVVISTSDAFNGECQVTDDNQVLFTPKQSFEGWGRCSYTVCVANFCDGARIKIRVFPDELIDRSEETLIVSPTPRPTNLDISNLMTTNLEPVANTDSISVEENQVVMVDVLANDVGVENDDLMVDSISQMPAHGDAKVVNGSVEYTPDVGFTGLDSFEYTACDTSGRCDSATVDVTVTPAPVPIEVTAVNDKLITSSDKAKAVDVLKNDLTNSNEPLQLIDASDATHGTCEVTEDKKVLYTPDLNYDGWDRCFYTVCAGNICEEGKIGIKIFPDEPNTRPPTVRPTNMPIQVLSASFEVLAVDDAAATAAEIISVDVTANDQTDSDLPLRVTNAQPGRHGQCEVTDANKVRYIPDGDYDGLDKCSYTVCAGNSGVCDEGVIEITVLSTPIYGIPVAQTKSPTNAPTDKPTKVPTEGPTPSPTKVEMNVLSSEVEVEKVYAEDETVVTSFNTPIRVDVTNNDFVKGMDPLVIAHTGGSKNGSCEITKDNKVLYIPNKDYVGNDQCGYIVCLDDMCDEGILTVKVTSQVAASKEMKPEAEALVTHSEEVRISPNQAKVCAHSKSRSNLGDRKLRGRKLVSGDGKKAAYQACVGASLITTVTVSNEGEKISQTLTYTSTFHDKSRSISPESHFSDLGILRLGRSASINALDNSYTETVVSFPVSEDATIVPGFPDQNFGMAPSLLVNSPSSSGGRFDSVLLFQTHSIESSVCVGGILNAKVYIYSVTATSHGGIFSTTSSKIWSEDTVTWNSGPKGDGILLKRLGPVERNQWYEIDVSSALHLGEPLGLRITSDAEVSAKAQYVSRNNENETLRPVLRITCLSFDSTTEGDV